MYSPEWELEELIARHPELLGLDPKETMLIERQKYLKNSGQYVDLLFKNRDFYIVVEVKAAFVKNHSAVKDQLIPYKAALAEEFGIPKNKIRCVLVSLCGFSDNVKKLCQALEISTKIVDKKSISRLLNIKEKHPFKFKEGSKIAKLFLEISNKAPIMAHEIGTSSDGKLCTNRDMWFWLFYSVMDRRANASTFIKAREALEKARLFAPYKITESLKKVGERATLNKIASILKDYSFPLLKDNIVGELSYPKSIIDAAKFISDYNYDFKKLYSSYLKQNKTSIKARDALWKDLQKKIYGVGQRIASQIVRGLVLKGPWDFPLNDNKFLEKCRFNVWMAGPTRLGLIMTENEYYNKLGEFADTFLEGNRGIVAHVLWYIRKKYCTRPPKCDECLLSNYCLRALNSKFRYTS